jgi:polyhydroxybutyrate depolymerase
MTFAARMLVTLLLLSAACADDDALRWQLNASRADKAADGGKRDHEQDASAEDAAVSAFDGGTRVRRDAAASGKTRDAATKLPVSSNAPTDTIGPGNPGSIMDGLDGGADDDAGLGLPGMPFPRHIDCSGKRGAPGSTTRTWNDREYIVHIPPAASPDTALPVMFVFHGSGGTGAQMQAATGFDILADQVGIITVYPNGQAGSAPWNVGRNVCPPGNFVSTTADDVAYVDAMLAGVEADQCVDKKRVFATGFSMGAYFSNELGCQIGRSTLRAIAPHSGGTHSGTCPGAPLPVLLLHGDSDSLINYNCGKSAHEYWVERNGCSDEVDTIDVTGGHCDFNRGCPADAPVAMCTFNGLDHAWAFPPTYENAGVLIWLFFSQFK